MSIDELEKRNIMLVSVGARLRSQVSDVQVIVLKAPGYEVELTCGGRPMVPFDAPDGSTALPLGDAPGATVLGKRYVDTGKVGVELLATKGGAGALALDGADLVVAQTKALPASD